MPLSSVPFLAEPLQYGEGFLCDDYCLGRVAKELGMPYVLFAGTRNPMFGNAILSRHPITGAVRSFLRADVTALRWSTRCMVSAFLPKFDVWVHCTHLDHVCESARLQQAAAAAKCISQLSGSGAAIFGGDFNALRRADYSQQQWDSIAAVRQEHDWEPPQSTLTDSLAQQGWQDAFDSLPAQGPEPLPGTNCVTYQRRPAAGEVPATCRFDTRIDYLWFRSGPTGTTGPIGGDPVADEEEPDCADPEAPKATRIQPLSYESGGPDFRDHAPVVATFDIDVAPQSQRQLPPLWISRSFDLEDTVAEGADLSDE
jgi:exonuclease III